MGLGVLLGDLARLELTLIDRFGDSFRERIPMRTKRIAECATVRKDRHRLDFRLVYQIDDAEVTADGGFSDHGKTGACSSWDGLEDRAARSEPVLRVRRITKWGHRVMIKKREKP